MIVPRRKIQRLRRIRETITTLLRFEEIPDYLKDNEFVQSGWRRELSLEQALMTIMTWHNESLNIWTHMIGAFIFIVWFFYMEKEWPLIVCNVSAIYLLSCSSVYHLLSCISENHYTYLRKMDFLGIILCMWSMFIPFTVYIWNDDILTIFIYMIVASAISGSSVIFALTPKFQTNSYHVIRVLTFAGNGIWGLIGLVHILIKFWEDTFIVKNILLALSSVTMHGIGATFYAMKFPERYSNREIYQYMSSHTIFHIFVVIGLVMFNIASIRLSGPEKSILKN